MTDALCGCATTLVHVTRNFDEAKELSKTAATMGRALIHVDFIKEELPRLKECLGVDLSHVDKLLEGAKKLSEKPSEASAFVDLAWRAFARTLQKCAETK
jgi:hypothetical protein